METMPNIKDLTAFCAVVDNGSISQAANALGETKGSISRRISRLEETLDIPLIQLKSGKAAPTKEGLKYKKVAEQAIELLQSAQTEIKDQYVDPQGLLRITTAQGIYRGTELSKYIAEFLDRFPKIQLEVLMTEKSLSLHDDELDFAIRTTFSQMKDSSLKATYLADLGMNFYATAKYLKKNGEPKHPSELKNHKLLVPRIFGDGINLTLKQKGKRKIHKFELSGSLLSQDFIFLEEVCLESGGIFIGSPAMNKKNKLVPILKDWDFPGDIKLYLLHPDRPLTPKAQVFKDLIKEKFR